MVMPMNYYRISSLGVQDLFRMKSEEKSVDMSGWELTYESPGGESPYASDGSRIIKWHKGDFTIHKCINVYGRAGYSIEHIRRRGDSLDFLKSLSEAIEYCEEHKNFDFSFWEDRGGLP